MNSISVDSMYLEPEYRESIQLYEPVGMGPLELLKWYRTLHRKKQLKYSERILELEQQINEERRSLQCHSTIETSRDQ